MSKHLIDLKNITKTYDDTDVLKDINLYIRDGEFLTLLGPSGCGKTTMLRFIAGFTLPDNGQILVDGKDISGVPPYRRQVNTVFQKYALFPHLNVFDNIAFGLKIQKLPKDEIESRVNEMMELVNLAGYGSRYIDQLSGGQQQRVAIARALVNRPRVLLLDEPLGALDLKLRKGMQIELKRMQQKLGITFIYVTHDQEEALTLSDRIAVFNKGYIEQIGTPNEIYNHSKTEFVCNFIGDINRVEAPIAAKMKLAAGQNHFIRLERLHVNKPKRDDEILIDGVVENIEYYGLYIKYYIDVGSQILKAIEKNDGINIYAPGEKVTVAMKPTDVMSYDAQ